MYFYLQISTNLRNFYASLKSASSGSGDPLAKETKHRMRKTATTRIAEAVKALALCHNVTPVFEGGNEDATEADRHTTAAASSQPQSVTYQASSPDEVALVSWSEEVGLALVDRNLSSMKLKTPSGDIMSYTILQVTKKKTTIF